MTPKVTVMDAVMESNDIKVGNNRAKGHPPPRFLRRRGVEEGAPFQSSYCV